ncbi:hypothetical protein KAZ57_01055 [Patescibacteria group bacterium]|nr:hypothetical protein [Patescibacteria group bacterium]
MSVYIEFFFTKIVGNQVLYWRNLVDISQATTDPDEIVLQIVKNDLEETPQIIKERFIIHSTSWRYETGKGIVLTYLIYADSLDFKKINVISVPFQDLRLAISVSHKKPRPEKISELNVVSHAIRHLAFLIKNGDHDKYKERLNKETIQNLKKLNVEIAGEI